MLGSNVFSWNIRELSVKLEITTKGRVPTLPYHSIYFRQQRLEFRQNVVLVVKGSFLSRSRGWCVQDNSYVSHVLLVVVLVVIEQSRSVFQELVD